MDLGSIMSGMMAQAGGVSVIAETSWWERLWFRDSGSNFASSTDAVFFYTFWTSTIFFVVLMFLMVYWGIKYRKKPGRAAQVSPAHHTQLEIVWTVVPTILFAIMFVWGLLAYLPMVIPPSNAEVINVTATQWNWSMTYPNGAQSLQTERVDDMEKSLFALRKGSPVKFVMSSDDVIHSFYIPEFRIKRDVFPNRYTVAWAEPTVATHKWDEASEKAVPIDPARPGFYLFCAEYCGDQHSQMAHRIAVMEGPDYESWIAKQLETSGIPLAELGAKLYVSKGCTACHRVDGVDASGPTWKGIWGEARPPAGGKTPVSAEVDFNYVRQSVLEPAAYIKAGWANQMPSFQGQLTNREVLAIATYIMSLTDSTKAAAEELSTKEMEDRGEDASPPDSEQFFNPTAGSGG